MGFIPDVSQAIIDAEATQSNRRIVHPGVVGDVIECSMDVGVGMTGAELPKDGAFFRLTGYTTPIGRTDLGPFVCPTALGAGDGAFYSQPMVKGPNGVEAPGPRVLHVRLINLHRYGD